MYLLIFILPVVYLFVLVRLFYYFYRGRDIGGWVLSLIVDLIVLVLVPWWFLLFTPAETVPTYFKGLVLAITIVYFWVSSRSRAQPPFLEMLFQFFLVLGIVISVSLLGEPSTAFGTIPIVCLLLLALERAHRAVVGDSSEVLDLPRHLDVLDDFTARAATPAPSYAYTGWLARLLAGPRIVLYPILLILAIVTLLVLFHLDLFDL